MFPFCSLWDKESTYSFQRAASPPQRETVQVDAWWGFPSLPTYDNDSKLIGKRAADGEK